MITSQQATIAAMLEALHDALTRMKYYPDEITPQAIDEALGLAEECLGDYQEFLVQVARYSRQGYID